jgi:hypothetical protein
MRHPLEGVHNKIIRAEEHLATIRAEIARHEHKCKIVQRKNLEDRTIEFIGELPEPPILLSVIVGDCFHNLRSALDHLVWQLVEANPPNRGSAKNQFPICKSAADFQKQAKTRLMGITSNAVAVIERLQPFVLGLSFDWHPLWRINELVNIDKHRTLMITTVFLQDWEMYLSNPKSFLAEVVFMSGDRYQHGEVIAKAPFDSVSDPEAVQINFVQRKFVVAFSDGPASSRIQGVDTTIEELIQFVKTDVLPRFTPFFA